jgi:ketosteroid isomerase-like protein
MKRRLIVLIAVLVASTGVSIAQQPDPASKVRDVLLKNAAAFERGDLATIEGLWSHGDDVVVFENGRANYGWADFRDHHLKPELAHVKNLRYQLSDINAHVSGPMAWAMFKFSMSSKSEGGTRERSGVGTAALERFGDDWKIVHWHSSSPRTNTPASPLKPQ